MCYNLTMGEGGYAVAGDCSFTDYVRSRFLDDIYPAAEEYVEQNCSKRGEKSPPLATVLFTPRILSNTNERENMSCVILDSRLQNRFNPPVQKLRKALEEGRFGKLTHASAVVRWFRAQDYYDRASWRGTWAMDGGCLMNQSIHNIDLLQWMMGPMESVFGYPATNLRKIEAEDVGVAVLKFKSGALGVIEVSITIYPENLEETLSIFGENGTVVLVITTFNVVRMFVV